MKELDETRKKFEKLSNPHKILSFVVIVLATIILTRLFVQFINPNPRLFEFELHHFDYGLFLLMWTSLLVIFGSKKHYLHLILFGISFGWILDDLFFIRSNILDPTYNEVLVYNSTLLETLILTGVIFLIAILIHEIFEKRKSKR
jgi:hypothetical protein